MGIRDEFNIFSGITGNFFFLAIITLITVLQVILGTFGGLAVSISYHGLDIRQWLIFVAMGAGCLVWSVILKLIPLNRSFFEVGIGINSPGINSPMKLLDDVDRDE